MIQEAVLGEKRVSRINGKAIRRSKLEAHYQALLHRIRAVDARSECVKSIGVISCAPGAGVSTVSFNLAVAAAHADCGPVLFVDADVTKRANERRIAASPAIG